jgi:pimeloyl-ACP methyl ester carboxylesterase
LGYEEGGDPGGHPLFLFHGWPGSRIEGRLGHHAAESQGVRLISVDRPGMGLSDHRPRRALVDWPDDLLQLAEALELERFAVLGISGGGPYAAACAWKVPERLTAVGIVSSLAPIDAPGVLAGMQRSNRLSFQVVGRVAPLRRAFFARLAVAARRHPEQIIENGAGAAVDKACLARPLVREILAQSLTEAFRAGGRGPAWETALYSRPWGFPLEEVRAPVHLSHGDADMNAPVAMGRYLAATIPRCRATFHPGEGHLHFIDHLPEILAPLARRSAPRGQE